MTQNLLKIACRAVLSITFCLLFTANLFAQKAPMKFGKIDQSDLEMTVYAPDTTAKAVILGDYGEVSYEMNVHGGFDLVYIRHLRVKILDQEATSYGDFKLKLWKGNRLDGQRIDRLKAVTYNMEEGELVKTALDKDDIYEEQITEYLYSSNFSLPMLKAGSVFDLEYTIISDLLASVPDWRFQSDIPAVFSELRFSYPEIYNFKQNMKGYLTLDINENSSSVGHYTGGENMGFVGNYKIYDSRFRIDDVPALKKEPYMNHPINYYAGLEFELTAYQREFGVYKDLTGSWPKIDQELLESEHFGLALNRTGIVKEAVDEIMAKTTDTILMIDLAHRWVKSHIKWNERNAVYTRHSLRKALDDQSGNSAEVNLLLVMLLRELGLQADPIISSTRNNGIIITAHPMLTKFNYVLAYCKFGSQELIIDATADELPFYLLPERAINSEGRIISKSKVTSGFINLALQNPATEKHVSQMMLATNGSLQARTTVQATQHLAADLAISYNKHQNKEAFMDDFESDHAGFELLELTNNNLTDWFKPFEQTYRYNIKDLDEETEKELMYINPLQFSHLKTNPFKEESRVFPVDFIFPKTTTKTVRISIPAGYKIDEVPENTAFALPNNSCVYRYHLVQSGSQIQLTAELQINESFFSYADYELLKSFFDQVVQKEDELIVISKI